MPKRWIGIACIGLTLLFPSLLWAAKTTYYFTTPVDGKAAYGYSPAEACASIDVQGEYRNLNYVMTFSTEMAGDLAKAGNGREMVNHGVRGEIGLRILAMKNYNDCILI